MPPEPVTIGDEPRTCAECGTPFVISVGEQEWFADRARREPGREWHLPRRCKACRESARRSSAIRIARQPIAGFSSLGWRR